MANVLMICGSLRKSSFNRALMNALPSLAPADMKLTEAPPFRSFPHYDADLQASAGFPADVTALANAIRARTTSARQRRPGAGSPMAARAAAMSPRTTSTSSHRSPAANVPPPPRGKKKPTRRSS